MVGYGLRAFRLLGRLLLAAAAAAALPAFAHSAIPLSVEPGTITVEAASTAYVVVAANVPGGRLGRTKLSIVAPVGVRAQIIEAPGSAAPGPRLTWIVALTPDPSLTAESTLLFRVEGGGPRTASLGFASVKLVPKAAPGVASQLAAEIVLDHETLLDGQRGTASVKLTNLSDATLATRTTLAGPGFLRISPPQSPKVLAPRASAIVPFELRVDSDSDNPLISGKHPLILSVEAQRRGGRPWTGTLVATQPLTIGVPGVAEIQSLIGVPSFLILPGFLLLTTFLVAWHLSRPKATATGTASPFSVSLDPVFWVTAVTLSAVVVFAYPRVTDLFGGRREILYGFDMSDVVRAWISCILLGPLLAGIALIGRRLLVNFRQRNAFRRGEEPLSFLHRLQRRGLGPKFPGVLLDDDSRLYALDLDEGSDQVWAAPAIQYQPSATPPEEFDMRALLEVIRNGDIDALVEALERAVAADAVQLAWLRAGAVTGPKRIARATFDSPEPQPKTIVIP